MLCDSSFSLRFAKDKRLKLFFFFSSRRRHTRCLSDWSSDVCSSDLPVAYRDTRATRRCGAWLTQGLGELVRCREPVGRNWAGGWRLIRRSSSASSYMAVLCDPLG